MFVFVIFYMLNFIKLKLKYVLNNEILQCFNINSLINIQYNGLNNIFL